jgi:hypothetical protein
MSIFMGMATLTFLLALALGRPQPECKPQFAPFSTGSHAGPPGLPFWRRDEAGDWGGSGWLGWSSTSGSLHPVRVIVRNRPKDNDSDDDVTVERIPEVTYAVRCVSQLRAAQIETSTLATDSLEPNRPVQISLGRRRYELRLQSSRDDLSDARVILTDGARSQVLYSVDGFADEPHFDIDWAGDLDRDGRLDLVVNLSRKYSHHPYRLLLSTKASAADIVGEAAMFETSD